jgi:6-phosphogluconolactonase (cycloisomerase 2 family)
MVTSTKHSVGLLAGLLLAGCSAQAPIGFQDSGAGDGDVAADAGVDATPDVSSDACAFCNADSSYDAAPSPKFFILVTETPAGSAQQSAWGGIERFDVADDFQPAQSSTAIPKTEVADPIGLAFRQTSAEVFVGNRRGMTTGSISRFLYHANDESFTQNGSEILMNDSAGAVMQLAFSHDEMELYAARDGNQITRFKLDSNGNMSSNGAITGLGNMIGVAVSKDGARLYATQQFSATIREFALPSGNELTGFTIPNASRPHLMVMDPENSRLYVSDIQSNQIYSLDVDVNDDLSLHQSVSATNPISVALSPDRKELFSTSHNFTPPDVIERFDLDNNNDWVSEGSTTTISTTTALGGTLVFLASSVPHAPN